MIFVTFDSFSFISYHIKIFEFITNKIHFSKCITNKYTISTGRYNIYFLEAALVLDPRSKCEPQENNSRDLVDESPSLEEQREKRVGVKQAMAEKGSREEEREE